MRLYRRLAGLLMARSNSIRVDNSEWEERHTSEIDRLIKAHMPSGSGIDTGTTIDLESSTPDRLVFVAGFHHMDQHGSYSGWTDHKIIVTPSLASEFDVRVTGRDRNEIKNYLAETYAIALCVEVA